MCTVSNFSSSNTFPSSGIQPYVCLNVSVSLRICVSLKGFVSEHKQVLVADSKLEKHTCLRVFHPQVLCSSVRVAGGAYGGLSS